MLRLRENDTLDDSFVHEDLLLVKLGLKALSIMMALDYDASKENILSVKQSIGIH
jgi:hypothetical protein